MRLRHLIGIVCMALIVFAGGVQPAYAVDLTITLKPGQAATVPLKFWCLDFGLKYPQIVFGPGQRAPDVVVAVLRAAIAKGAVNTDPYETELAIWRATTGSFHDYANLGTVLAQQIYSDSLTFKVPPLPADLPTLDKLVVSGTVTTTLVGFSAQPDPNHPNLPGEPFFGTAKLLITNTSKSQVRFLLAEGATFSPPAGANDQHLVSHQDTSQVTQLPPTGDDLQVALPAEAALVGIAGASCLALATWLWRRAHSKHTT
jgi:hypothetical protein